MKIGAEIEIQRRKIVSRLFLIEWKVSDISLILFVRRTARSNTTPGYQPVKQSTEVYLEFKKIEEIIHIFQEKVKRLVRDLS